MYPSAAYRRAWTCTFVTSGQVASITLCCRVAEFAWTRGRHTVRRVDHGRALRNLRLLVDEDRAAGLEVADDVDVVDDLLAHVHRCAVVLEGLLDRVDGALDPCAVAARRCEENAFDHADRVSVPGEPRIRSQ